MWLNGRYIFIIACSLLKTWAKERDPKVLSLFSIVSFPNLPCVSQNNNDIGTCYTPAECGSRGGTASGNCASGFGVCCLFIISTCGSTVTQNTSYITNPGFPTPLSGAGATSPCAFTIIPLNTGICQLRLDFENFDLVEQPPQVGANAGGCIDMFEITSTSGRIYPILCGTLTGQHIYIETGRQSGAQTLEFTLGAMGMITFRIQISQIECQVPYKAPSDCFQYFTGASGRVMSFNFNGDGGMPTSMINTGTYTVCVRKEEGFCGIEWTPTPNLPAGVDPFQLSVAFANVALNDAKAVTEAAFIAIPGSPFEYYSGDKLSQDGEIRDATILSTAARFLLEVTTIPANDANNGLGLSEGFDLSYFQGPCI